MAIKVKPISLCRKMFGMLGNEGKEMGPKWVELMEHDGCGGGGECEH